jgi:pimeloyl-ACP methyl ester carboxylesterase
LNGGFTLNKDIIIQNRKGYRLRGVVHTPDKGAVKDQPIVLIVPGIDGTKVGPHRMLKKVSTVLERRDVVSYRFDLTGQGESDGDFTEITVQTHLDDVEDILRAVRDEDTKVIMAGYSMGGLVAGLAATQLRDVVGVAMLSPTFNLADTVNRRLERMEPGEDAISFIGNLMTRRQLERLVPIDVREALSNLACRSLMITGDSDKTVPKEVFTDYRQEVLKSACAHYRITHADHSFSTVDSEQQVLRLISDFVCSIPVPVTVAP